MRVKSIKQLGKGHWKIASITPVKEAKTAVSRASGSISGPQLVLWQRVSSKWPSAVSEYNPGIPGRRFRLDVAFVESKLCIECDGWEFHGKFLSGFKKDRIKQNLLVMHGWRVLRFTASDIYQRIDSCMAMIEEALSS